MIKDGLSAVNSAVDIAKKVPVDEQSKEEIGKNLGNAGVTVAKLVNNLLLPVEGVNWIVENVRNFFSKDVKERIEKIPEENRITPKNSVIGNVAEAVKYLDNDEQYLKDMYANLIATACDNKQSDNIHPSFIEIIKQLNNSDILLLQYIFDKNNHEIAFFCLRQEDKSGHGVDVLKYLLFDDIFKVFSNDPNKISESLENLERLKLIDISTERFFTKDELYEPIRQEEFYKAYQNTFKELFKEQKGIMAMTSFGKKFMKSCLPTSTSE